MNSDLGVSINSWVVAARIVPVGCHAFHPYGVRALVVPFSPLRFRHIALLPGDATLLHVLTLKLKPAIQSKRWFALLDPIAKYKTNPSRAEAYRICRASTLR